MPLRIAIDTIPLVGQVKGCTAYTVQVRQDVPGARCDMAAVTW